MSGRLTAAGTIRAIAEIDPGVAARIFGSRDAIALGGWPGSMNGRSWASSARFAEDVANETIQDDLQVAMYDPEHWDATPLDERLDPHASIEAFGTSERMRSSSSSASWAPTVYTGVSADSGSWKIIAILLPRSRRTSSGGAETNS